jgi:hypothetical protein
LSPRKKPKKSKAKEVKNKGPSSDQLEAAKAIILGVEMRCLKRDRKSVKEAIEDGMELVKAEKKLFGKDQSKRGNWGKYLKEFDSHLKPRTIQRYIQLAKNVDLEKHPTLAYLGRQIFLSSFNWAMERLRQRYYTMAKWTLILTPRMLMRESNFNRRQRI